MNEIEDLKALIKMTQDQVETYEFCAGYYEHLLSEARAHLAAREKELKTLWDAIAAQEVDDVNCG